MKGETSTQRKTIQTTDILIGLQMSAAQVRSFQDQVDHMDLGEETFLFIIFDRKFE